MSELDPDGRMRWPWSQLVEVKNELGSVISALGGASEHADETRAQRVVDALVGGIWAQPLDADERDDIVPIHRGQADRLIAAIDQLRAPTPAQIELRAALARAFPTSHDRRSLRRLHLVTQSAAAAAVTAFERSFAEIELFIDDDGATALEDEALRRAMRVIHDWRRAPRPDPSVLERSTVELLAVLRRDGIEIPTMTAPLIDSGVGADDATAIATLVADGVELVGRIGEDDPYTDATVHERITETVDALATAVVEAAERGHAPSLAAGGSSTPGSGSMNLALRTLLDWIGDRRLRSVVAILWGWQLAREHVVSHFDGWHDT